MGLFSKKKNDDSEKAISQEGVTGKPLIENQGDIEAEQVKGVPELPETPPEGVEYKDTCIVKGCNSDMTTVCPTCGKKLCDEHKSTDKHDCKVKIEIETPNAPEVTNSDNEQSKTDEDAERLRNKPVASEPTIEEKKVVQVEGL